MTLADVEERAFWDSVYLKLLSETISEIAAREVDRHNGARLYLDAVATAADAAIEARRKRTIAK